MNAFQVAYRRYADNIALITADGKQLSYSALELRVNELVHEIANHTLLILDCENTFESVVFYLAALDSGTPVFLVNPEDEANVDTIKANYAISGHYRKRAGKWVLKSISRPEGKDTGEKHPEKSHCALPHHDLAVILSTSGSTGVAKQIKLSAGNLAANAQSIVEYLDINESDRAATSLPFNYSYGLSIVNSHLCAGASLFLNERSLTDNQFWDDFSDLKCTSFAGVPYTYELIEQSVFPKREFPALKYFTQAGGKLPALRASKFHDIAKQKDAKFFVMYGQTEATARMSYVPPDALGDNADTIGIAIPGGKFSLRDEDGERIDDAGIEGELVYSGPNIMMGYAKTQQDLAIDEQLQSLSTGDLALRQANGFYKITGRKSRFIKPFGIRIGLDSLEARLSREGLNAVCTGSDDCLYVMDDSGLLDAETLKRVLAVTRLPASHVKVATVNSIPRGSNGKTDYQRVMAIMSRGPGLAARARATVSHLLSNSNSSVKAIFEDKLDVDKVNNDDSFKKLGGDSLTFIQTSMALQSLIPNLPDDWHLKSVDELNALAASKRKRSPYVKLDAAIFARFVAISMIVIGHFEIINYGIGSAFLLLFLAGYSFGNYQFSTILQEGRAAGQIRSLLKIAIPTVGYMLLLQLSQGSVDLSSVFLVSNFVSVNPLTYWFIEVYVQVTLLMILVLLLAHRSATLRERPYGLICSVLVVSVVLSVAIPALVWNSDYLYNRLPHMLGWVFVFGLLLSQTRKTATKLFLSCIWLPLSYFSFGESCWFFHIGGLLLFWIPAVYIPRILQAPVMLVASASLFIYLTHFQFKVVLTKIGLEDAAILAFFVAMLGGVLIWKVYSAIERYVVEKLSLDRRFALPQAKPMSPRSNLDAKSPPKTLEPHEKPSGF